MNKIKFYLVDFYSSFLEEKRNTPMVFWTELVGMLLVVSAGALIAVFADNSPFILLFSMFILGNILLLVSASLIGRGKLVILNFGFVIINIAGLVKYIF